MSEPNITDQRHYEPQSPEELEREFAGWHIWRGVNRLWYARLAKTSPPVMVERREDLMDLRDGIISAIWRRENGIDQMIREVSERSE